MSDDKIKHLSDQQRGTDSKAIRDAMKRAKQHIRNVGAQDLDEPEGFASGDMKKFLEDPDAYEKEDNDERNKDQ